MEIRSAQIDAVDVLLTGKASTRVHWTTQSGGKHSRTIHHWANGTEAVVALRAPICSGMLAPGRFQMPFQFQLPPSVPSAPA